MSFFQTLLGRQRTLPPLEGSHIDEDSYNASLQALQNEMKLSKTYFCRICGTIDPNTKRLDCGHSPFCMSCLERDFAPVKMIQCPCQVVTQLYERSLKDLEVDPRRRQAIQWEESIAAGEKVNIVSEDNMLIMSRSIHPPPDEEDDTLDRLGFISIRRSSEINHEAPLEELLPFTLSPDIARRAFADWLGSHWLIAAELLQNLPISKPVCYFVPFYLYTDVKASSTFLAAVPRARDERKSYFARAVDFVSRAESAMKTINGRLSHTFPQLLQPATNSLPHKLLAALIALPGAFSYATQSILEDALVSIESERAKPSRFETIQLKVDVLETEAFTLRQSVTNKEVAHQCIKHIKQTENVTIVEEFEVFVEFEKPDTKLVLLPVFYATYEVQNRSYELLASGFRAGFIVGDPPPSGFGSFGVLSQGLINSMQKLV